MARGAVLERDVPLSRSKIWKLGQGFYDQAGIDAWNKGIVPTWVTTNTCIAGAFARLVAAHVRDLAGGAYAKLDRARPVNVVELGAGSGRLGFLFLKKYAEATRGLPLARIRVRYVLTDFTRTNVAYWAKHPALQPMVEDGRLDFAVFDAEKDEQLRLEVSGEVLSRRTLTNPLVVIATYVLCTMTHDAFRIEGGRLQEMRTSLVSRRRREPDHGDPSLLDRVELRFAPHDAAPRHYGDRALDAVLDWYRKHLANTCFTVPVGGLRCAGNLLRLARDRLALIVADVGYNRPLELLGYSDLQPMRAGSPYTSVNLHAIERWFEDRGGTALHTSPRDGALVVSAFSSAPRGALPHTAIEFADALDGFGPLDFYGLQETAGEGRPTLRQMLALLRLSGHDPLTLYQLAPRIAKLAASCTALQAAEIAEALEECWSNHYPIGDETDANNMAHLIGWVMASMGRHEDAIRHYERALRDHGPEPTLLDNLRLSYAETGRVWRGR